MSIVLKDGTVLPDIPSDVLAECPYFVVVRCFFPDYGIDACLASANKMPYTKISYTTDGFSVGLSAAGQYMTGSYEDESWLFVPIEDGPATVAIGEGTLQTNTLLYANHNILDEAGEIYFPNSIPPFVLPDGTELPALPEGVFEKYPYGHIIVVKQDGVIAGVVLAATAGEMTYVPAALSGEDIGAVSATAVGCLVYEMGSTLDAWSLDSESETERYAGEIIAQGDIAEAETFELQIAWSNHDILVATVDNGDGSFTPGPDLYRKSDVNYRVYGGWLNSMANQARRLGNVSGALKPGEMETVFKGATAGGGISAEGVKF